MKNLDTYLHKALVYSFYFLFLTLPLIWYPTLSELFEFPKMVYVYVFTVIIFSLWLSRMIVTHKLIFTRSKFDLPIILFVASQIISTILSIHPHTSIYGYYSRFHGGLLSTLSYITLYYAFIANLDKKLTTKAIGFIVAGAVMASLYALPEHYGYSPSCLAVTGEINVDCWVQDVQTRIYGTFGQPNWLAAYLIIVSPLVLFLSTKLKKTLTTQTLIILLIQILFFAVLLFTRSKSGLIGYTLAFVIFQTVNLIKSRSSLKQSLLSLLVIIALALRFGTEYTPSLESIIAKYTKTEQDVVQTVGESVGTVLENGGTNSGQIRKIVWTGALEVFKHNPLFGTGVETFAYSYYKYRPMEHNDVSEWDFLYNKAHNEILNFAATTGIFGLGSYLLFMLFYTVHTLFYAVKNKGGDDLLPIALFAGFLGLSVSNFLGFSTVSVSLLFFLYPAIYLTYTNQSVSFLPTSSATPKYLSKKEKKLLKNQDNEYSIGSLEYISLTIVGITALFYLNQNLKYLQADLYYSNATKLENAGNLSASLADFQKAIKLSPNEPIYYNDFADTLSKASITEAQAGRETNTITLAQNAFSQSAQALKLNPYHINFYKTQAGVYIRLSALDAKQLENAKAILIKALALAPTDAKLTYNLALINSDQGNNEETQKLLEQTIAMKPNYEAARMQLADLYTKNKNYAGAKEQYEYILKFIAPQNTKAQESLDKLPKN